MTTDTRSRIEPSPAIVDAVRQWLAPVRTSLGDEFLACYLTGSALHTGFDPKRSGVNLLLIARSLDLTLLDRVHDAMPRDSKATPRIESLFMSELQMRRSLDAFSIEWVEIAEAHLLIEGQDVIRGIEVPILNLRLQCEHELRVKLMRLRHSYLADRGRPKALAATLSGVASSFATLFRTLIRLREETPPAQTPEVVQRVADLYQLDARGLIGAYQLRFSDREYADAELLEVYRRFLVEIDRLVNAIDTLQVG
ncbi:MAG: hypothetical protein HOP12_11685 [Candidatus Eisenbacteria bacterium]|uniref:Nucleotidyltransferase domain-containing protein n=1 Tax=Eiseniibacteriota bacterium TaxID=2212470 RepID=A0A849SPJ6_UNCEI|nr:hypothetical protein [Candidatus Eisenbacteria bacterium]